MKMTPNEILLHSWEKYIAPYPDILNRVRPWNIHFSVEGLHQIPPQAQESLWRRSQNGLRARGEGGHQETEAL